MVEMKLYRSRKKKGATVVVCHHPVEDWVASFPVNRRTDLCRSFWQVEALDSYVSLRC